MPILSKLGPQQSRFYHFLILHSGLIGLFPFFIPVFLWREGYSLAGISFYISLTGLSFCFALWCWDRIRLSVSPRGILIASCGLELLLLATLFLTEHSGFIFLLALLVGLYNGFYWMTQRSLFVDIINTGNSGNSFGNLQIVALIALKLGMLCGGWLLEKQGVSATLLFSSLVIGIGLTSAWILKLDYQSSSKTWQSSSVPIRHALGFNDQHHAKPVFIIDGIFLFLESHFWLLSLFFIAEQNFARLSILVIALGLVFSLFFVLTKRVIDKVPGNLIYQLTITGYAFSWLLRGHLPDSMGTLMVGTLVLITFLTSLFRLSFNKRFFDHALGSDPHTYLVTKSYLSQLGLSVGFVLIGALFLCLNNEPEQGIRLCYWLAVPLCAVYWLYSARSSRAIA